MGEGYVLTNKYNLVELLNYIDPALLDYQEWCSVGMALKDEGYTAADWDSWSRRDSKRYHAGECFKKWDTFKGTSEPVTGGTIVQMAKDHGWEPERGHALDWDATIGPKDELVVIDRHWLEGKEVEEPANWDPVSDLIRYLDTLFEAEEHVGYVTESGWNEERQTYFPKRGAYDRTAGELIQQLGTCQGDIGSVLGDYKPEVGAWIRFNPLDGNGVKDANVTEYRYALVEADEDEHGKEIPIDEQHAMIRELELPVACLVHSGKKSLHAIVRIDAKNYDEYRKRVDYLYDVCRKNGFHIDKGNKNPSRLSRMPGVLRNGHKQFLVDTNFGKESWNEWAEWIEAVNDDLPDPESLATIWDNLPQLSPPLIDGVLRQGHKMMLAGPSKAGKSFALIELCIAIAEGKKWMGWDCAQGRVMYVNLELDAASGFHRFKDVYARLGWEANNLHNIDIWNLRGKSAPMDKLAPKLIRRAAKQNYIAIIIDPIYKVITGDENSADQMAHFTNQFDLVCHELGAAVIYCHHHSKGFQGSKRSMDRASGSGVFARDPDALLDLIELDISEDLRKQQENSAVCELAEKYLKRYVPLYQKEVSQDDLCSQVQSLDACGRLLGLKEYGALQNEIEAAKKTLSHKSAWRIEGTLREFAKFQPVNMWFEYPIHTVDTDDLLKDAKAEGETAPWQRGGAKEKKSEKNYKAETENAYEACKVDGQVTLEAMAEYLGLKSTKAVRNRIEKYTKLEIENGIVIKK
jgi:hypothetical protein